MNIQIQISTIKSTINTINNYFAFFEGNNEKKKKNFYCRILKWCKWWEREEINSSYMHRSE